MFAELEKRHGDRSNGAGSGAAHDDADLAGAAVAIDHFFVDETFASDLLIGGLEQVELEGFDLSVVLVRAVVLLNGEDVEAALPAISLRLEVDGGGGGLFGEVGGGSRGGVVAGKAPWRRGPGSPHATAQHRPARALISAP